MRKIEKLLEKYFCGIISIIILLREYFAIQKHRYLLKMIFPLLLGLLSYFLMSKSIYLCQYNTFFNNIATISGILLGFTISILAIFLSINNKNVEDAKEKKLEIKLYKDKVSLYDSVFVSYIYVIVIEVLLLLLNFIFPLFVNIAYFENRFILIILLVLLTHIIVELLISIIDLYFILTKKTIK